MNAHDLLVQHARKWLCKKYPVVITEIATGGRETPDAIGFSCEGSTVIECKTNRADFLADKKKFFRQRQEDGLGDRRYYLTLKNLIKSEELPRGWGLLELEDRAVFTRIFSLPFLKNRAAENILLLSVIRRMHVVSHRGVSIKHYKFGTKNRAMLVYREAEQQEKILQEEK